MGFFDYLRMMMGWWNSAREYTLIGEWSNVIDCRSSNERIECYSANERIECVSSNQRIDL